MLCLTRHRGEAVIIRKLGREVALVRLVRMGEVNLTLHFSGPRGVEFISEQDDRERTKTLIERDEVAVLEDGIEIARIWIVGIGTHRSRIGFSGDREAIRFIREEIAGTSRDTQVVQSNE